MEAHSSSQCRANMTQFSECAVVDSITQRSSNTQVTMTIHPRYNLPNTTSMELINTYIEVSLELTLGKYALHGVSGYNYLIDGCQFGLFAPYRPNAQVNR